VKPDHARLSEVLLVVFDVDGVLTDGRLGVASGGETEHRFHVRDGLAFVKAHLAGLKIGVISGRKSASVGRRLRELRVHQVQQGISDKATALRAMCQRMDVLPRHTAFVGDDVNDLVAMKVAGLGIAPLDAVPEVRAHLEAAGGWVLSTEGGGGCAREVLQAVLTARGLWTDDAGTQP